MLAKSRRQVMDPRICLLPSSATEKSISPETVATTMSPPVKVNAFVELGRGTAVLGAHIAPWVFWPRAYGAVDVRFRERYLTAEPVFTRLHLTDSQSSVELS